MDPNWVLDKKKLRVVNIDKIVENLGLDLCKAISAFHAISGRDYTATFSRKWKIRPFTILHKDKYLQQIFTPFGDAKQLSEMQISGM